MYELIEHRVVPSASTTLAITNIPQDGTDLLLIMSLRDAATGNTRPMTLRANGSTSGYSGRILDGTGAAVSSPTSVTTGLSMTTPGSTATANTFGNLQVYIPNYSLSGTTKVASIDSVTEHNAATTVSVRITAGILGTTDPITSLSLIAAGGSAVAGSTLSLYKINRTSAIGKPKAIGGNITYANGYWVHTFTGSGTFYAQEDLSLEYLVIAGGGGGGRIQAGSASGGGGGAGGYRSSVSGELSGQNSSGEPPLSIKARSAYQVLVGTGGAGGQTDRSRGTQGSSSILGPIIATGGGWGTGEFDIDGGAGGSGGGGGHWNSRQTSGGAGTAGQGFAGGNVQAGAGGGAGGVGDNGNLSTPNGGVGLASTITGEFVRRAGGGLPISSGSSARSATIWGGGGSKTSDNNGVANTGGGGGGSETGLPTGNGGSGVVIVRYRA